MVRHPEVLDSLGPMRLNSHHTSASVPEEVLGVSIYTPCPSDLCGTFMYNVTIDVIASLNLLSSASLSLLQDTHYGYHVGGPLSFHYPVCSPGRWNFGLERI